MSKNNYLVKVNVSTDKPKKLNLQDFSSYEDFMVANFNLDALARQSNNQELVSFCKNLGLSYLMNPTSGSFAVECTEQIANQIRSLKCVYSVGLL